MAEPNHPRGGFGLKAHINHIDGIAVVHTDHIHPLLMSAHQRAQVGKKLAAAKVLDKIVAAAAGVAADRRMVKARSAVDDLIQRAVTAAGIKAQGRGIRLAAGTDVLRRVPRRAGHVDFIRLRRVQLAQRLLDHWRCILVAGTGIDDKDMPHKATSLCRIKKRLICMAASGTIYAGAAPHNKHTLHYTCKFDTLSRRN